MRFKTATLGCKVNRYETELLRTAFVANGWEDADEDDSPNGADVDFVLIDTCSVTAESDAKSRKTVARFAKLYPNAEIVVVGCFAASAPDVAARLPNVSEVVPDKRDLIRFLRRRGLKTLPTGVERFAERRRAFVKVQDGCRVGCAYCIIPSTRPYLQTRRPEDALAEIRALAANGYREIVLTGIHLGHYGLDLCPPTPDEIAATGDPNGFGGFDPSGYAANFEPGPNAELIRLGAKPAPVKPTPAPPLDVYLRRRALVPPEERTDLALLLRTIVDAGLPIRTRLGSLEAVEVCDRVLRVFEEYPNALCPHFHLSMQSGDDAVLAAMRRRWSSEPFIERCREISRRVPDAALTTDVIVGFPGETDAQFERTCDVVRDLGFSRTHVFRYSPRPGTVAAAMRNQIPPEVKKARAARLQTLARELRESFAERFVGRTARVLIEEIALGANGGVVASGTTDRYFEVELPFDSADAAKGIALGDMFEVELTARRGDVFIGKRI